MSIVAGVSEFLAIQRFYIAGNAARCLVYFGSTSIWQNRRLRTDLRSKARLVLAIVRNDCIVHRGIPSIVSSHPTARLRYSSSSSLK